MASAVVSLFRAHHCPGGRAGGLYAHRRGRAGGNAGTQTMTIMVRSLALKEIEPRYVVGALARGAWSIINGLTVGVLVALIAWFWQGKPVPGAGDRACHAGQSIVRQLPASSCPWC